MIQQISICLRLEHGISKRNLGGFVPKYVYSYEAIAKRVMKRQNMYLHYNFYTEFFTNNTHGGI